MILEGLLKLRKGMLPVRGTVPLKLSENHDSNHICILHTESPTLQISLNKLLN